MTWIWNCCLCKPVIVILAPHSCRLTPLLLDCITLNLHACTCLYRCGVRMCSYSTCPFYLTVFSRLVGGCGERAILLHSSALAAANVESWLEGHTAAAGPAPAQRRWLSLALTVLLAISRMLCSVAISSRLRSAHFVPGISNRTEISKLCRPIPFDFVAFFKSLLSACAGIPLAPWTPILIWLHCEHPSVSNISKDEIFD